MNLLGDRHSEFVKVSVLPSCHQPTFVSFPFD
jgi:hypothetical protein